ncbi:MAG: UvrD-helicase domain-containing protein, partial [Clostridia bacterium]|nr:UvrD-helicase domain-containing protein [Clostridia bacterium]
DFSDLEHACLQALRAPEVAQEVSDKFKFTFVDEYQDTSPLQEAIVQAVAGEGNLFMVGDLKQAIYSFRDCDPGLFRHKMHTFPMQRGGKNRVIYLDQNFRSAPALLTGINDLFKTFMNAQTLDIDYDDTQSLKPGLDVEDGPIEVHFTKDADDEARAAAAALLKWKNENKELQWRDCAVLLRTPRGERLAASIYANILQSAGIPCRMEPCEPLFDAPENRLLIELCRFCDNSRRELPLLSVLLSPLFGYTVDELLRARLFSREETLYNCMRRAVPGFWQTVSRWQDNAATSDPADWLWNIIEETGYTQTKNVQALMHHCERFCDDTSAPTLHSMLQYLDAVSQKRDYLGDPAEPGEEDAVSILSVHKSKGLEWPCVVVGGCGKGFRGRPKDAIIWDSNIGIGPRYYDVEARLTGHTPASRCLSWQAEDKERAEEARLLYVAMTRAKRKLVLVGTYDAEEERFGELPDGPLRAGNAGCWADWIAPSFSLYTESKPTLLLLPVAGLNHRKSDAWISPTEEITEEAVQNQHSVPAKISVTAYLKNQTEIIIHETDDTLPPADLETGTAYHSTLEKLDFANKNPILPSAIDPEVINWFLSTDLAQEMSAAPELLREQPFTYLLDDTLITGVIDACFRTPQGYVIVDYKVSRQTSAALKTQYAPQLQFYAKAAAELTGQPVVRLCLVHLMRREIIVI